MWRVELAVDYGNSPCSSELSFQYRQILLEFSSSSGPVYSAKRQEYKGKLFISELGR